MIAKAITSTPFSGRTTASPRRTGLTSVFFKIAKPLFLLLLLPGWLLSAAGATTVPPATITLIGGQVTNVFSSDSFTVTFTTAQTGLSASNFTVPGTVTGAFVSSVTGSGTTWTVIVTIPGSFQSQGTFTLTLANSTNLTPGLSGLPVAGPTVQVIAYPLDGTFSLSSTNANSGYAKTGDKINFTLTSAHYLLETWNVNVAGQNANGSLNFSSVVTGQVTLGSGTAQGPLAWGWSYTNTFNESNAGSGTSGIIFDSVNPTVNISAPSVSSTGTGPVTYNVTYADANFNTSTLSTSNITLNKTGSANGTVTLVENSATNYTVTISNITGAGTLGISIGAGTASDMAGNLAPASGPSTTFNVVDLRSQTTTSISSDNNPSFSAAPNNSVTFTAAVRNSGIPVTSGTVNFKSNGADISGGTSVALDGNGLATVHTIFTTSGPYTILATYSGDADFISSSGSLTQQVILHPTTISSIIPVGNSPTNAATLDYTVTFATALTTPPSISDFSLTGTASGTISSVTGSGTTYDVNVTNVSGNGPLELDMTSGSDVSPTVSNVPFTGYAYTIDNTPPTASPITFSSNDPNPAIAYPGETVTLSFTTSEQVLPPMVNIAGQSVQATTPDNVHFAASYMIGQTDLPDPNGNVPYSISIADQVLNTSNYASTNAGIANIALRQLTPVIGGIAPAQPLNAVSGTASPSVSFNVSGDNMTAYVMVSAPLGFEISNDNLSFGGSATTGGPGTFHSMLYIRLAATDAVGPYSGNIRITGLNATEVDLPVSGSVTPQPTMVVSITPASPAPTNATTLDYTVTFADALTTPPSISDFTLTGGATGTINSITGSGTTYDVNVTNVSGNGSLELDMTGGSDDVPAISNVPFTGGAYTIDNTPPALAYLFYEVNSRISSSVVGVGGTVSLGFDTNEPIQSATVTIAGHTVTVFSGGGKGNSATYTMTSGDTEGRVPFTLTITDLAGNSSSYTDVTQSDDVEFDMTPPTVTISAPSVTQISTAGSGTVTYTVTYADANFNTSTLTPAGIALNTTGTATGTVAVTGSGTTYTVTISNITGLGTLGISLAGGYASDLAGNTDAGAGASATFDVVLSSDATLASLSLSSGTLSPTFSPGGTSYTAAVPNSVSSITVTASANDGGASVTTTVNGAPASGSAPLNVGSNAISVVVTAADGTTKTYTVTVTRGQSINSYLAAINPSVGHVSPAFTQTNTAYTLSVSNAIASITVKPVSTDPGATLKVDGSPLTSGTVSNAIALAEGTQTPLTIVVRAANGSTRTYSVTVTRAPSADAKLSSIQPGAGALKPAFVSPTISYTDAVPNISTSTAITPTAEDANATITVNGSPATSGSPFTLNNLVVGTNTATILVTAQDGSTKKTYTVTVTRAPSINAYLASLNPNIKPLSPIFVQGAYSYALEASNTTATMTIAPVTAEPNATMTINTAPATSGATFGPIALAQGPNIITIVVKAQDGISTKTYTITVTRDAPAGDNNVYQPVSVEKPISTPTLADEGILVHQGLSPNGDGQNDFLQIDNIGQYPENKLSIMNRNGQLVYEAKGYDNSSKAFDGHSNKNGQMQLPGTYFYQLDYTVNGTAKHKTGFIVLKY